MIKIGNDFKNNFELNHTIYKNRQKQLHYPIKIRFIPVFTNDNGYVRVQR